MFLKPLIFFFVSFLGCSLSSEGSSKLEEVSLCSLFLCKNRAFMGGFTSIEKSMLICTNSLLASPLVITLKRVVS